MGRERFLDLSHLEPPTPLVQAISAIGTLDHGDYLRLLLKRDPIYLYPILLVQGYEHESRALAQAVFEVLVWHKGDDEAWHAAHADRDTEQKDRRLT